MPTTTKPSRPRASSAPERTRGGWTPTGTAAARRAGDPPPGSKAERTRERLLDATRVVARRHGYHDTTVAQVVSEAGVARGSFYTYFESKHDVMRALVSRLGAAIDRDVAFVDPSQPDDPSAEVRRATERYLDLAHDQADVMDLVDQMAAVDEQVARDRDASRRRYASQVAVGIQRWQNLGLADPAIDAQSTAAALVAMLIEVGRTGPAAPDAATMAATVARIWIGACGIEDGDP